MKRAILLILAFILVMPINAVAQDGIYKDVGYDKWYSRAVFVMKDESVMQGDYFGFRPEDDITRAEFVTILSRLAKAETEIYDEAAFDDAPIDAWYGKVIAWAKEAELVDGYSSARFGPDDPITREQMCVILANFIEKYSVVLPEGAGKDFADSDEISEWAEDAVAKCTEWSVVSGMEKDKFCPSATATRAQIAQLIYNMLLNADAENSGIEVPEQGGADDAPPELHYTYYKSFDEFADYILNIGEKEIAQTTYLERMAYSYLDKWISDDEFRYGFFGSFVNKMREDDSIMYPCVNGEEAVLADSAQQVSFHPSAAAKRPEITYQLQGNVFISMRYLDRDLCDKGKENGAAWLMRTLNENTVNVHNFEQIKQDKLEQGNDIYKDLTVYEKEYQLADRTVKAMVRDNSAREVNPYYEVWFV